MVNGGGVSAWSQILALSVGGALGVNARFWLGEWMGRWVSGPFPWATVTINVTGSFAIGFLAVILAHHWPYPLGRLFVVTGFLGGYTTFSSFSFESLKLWEDGRKGLAAVNSLGSVLLGLVAVILGVALARTVLGPQPEFARPSISASAHDHRNEGLELPSEAFLEEGKDA